MEISSNLLNGPNVFLDKGPGQLFFNVFVHTFDNWLMFFRELIIKALKYIDPDRSISVFSSIQCGKKRCVYQGPSPI